MLSAVVELVADLNTSRGGTVSLGGYNQLEVNGITFLNATTLSHGWELWRTDGTDAGTFRLTDIMPGPSNSYIEALTEFGNELIFIGQNRLWKSNGTVAGTQLIQEPSSSIGLPSSSVIPVIGDEFVFSSGNKLWKSDGTDSGTQPFFEFRQYSGVQALSPASNGKFYFSTHSYDRANGQYATSLWVSDGTETGTRIVRTFDGYSAIKNWVVKNGRVFFLNESSTDGESLWTSDGTDSGTMLITHNPGEREEWWNPRIVATENDLFFTVNTQHDSNDLWAYSFAEQSLVQLTNNAESPSQVYYRDLVAFENNLYFVSQEQLWRSNGMVEGTTRVQTPVGVSVRSVASINEKLVLSVFDADYGAALWTSDGTAPGTSLLKDLFSGTSESTDHEQPVYFPSPNLSGVALVVAGDDSASFQIWGTDGTSSHTHRLADVTVGTDSSNLSSIESVNGELIFLTGQSYYNTDTLWSGDSETHIIINQGGASELGSVDGDYYYVRNSDGNNSGSSGIYRWDGMGDEFVLNLPSLFHAVSPPLNIASATYFLGNRYDPVQGRQMFQLRRSINGGLDSTLVKEFPQSNGYSVLENFQNFRHNEFIVFLAPDEIGRLQLWRSDGTSEGTFMLLDSYIYNFERSNLFTVGDGNQIIVNSQNGLIITDGSVAGTHRLRDWLPEGGYVHGLAALSNNYLFFRDTTLWKTDGTEAGTMAFKTNLYGSDQATAVIGEFVYFIGDVYDYGYQTALWKSDGTESGTEVIFRFDTAIDSFKIKDFKTVGDKLIFTLLDDNTGYRTIWISDGTEAGTLPLRNNLDGKLILEHDAQFTLYNDGIAFQAATEDVGYELFRIDTTTPVAVPEQLSVIGDSEEKTISWPEVSGAIQYEVWLQNLTDKSLPPIRFRTNDSLINIRRFDVNNYWFDIDLYPELAPKIRFDADLPDGTYRVWVRSLPVLGKPSAWSARKDFIIAAQPEISFYHDSNSFSPNYRPSGQTLKWSGSANTVSYEIWIVNLDTKKLALRKTEISGTKLDLTNLLVRGNYTVSVRGQLAVQTFTEWSASYKFFVLGAAVPLTSTDTSTTNPRPVLTWSAVDGATGYDVYVYLQNSATLVDSAKNVKTLTHTPQKDLPGGKLLVYVRALKNTQPISAWGTGNVLWMKLPPTNLRTTETGFAWNVARQAGSYTFELRGTNGALYVPRKTQSGTTIDFGKPLPPGKYSLRVFVSYSKVSSVWSETLTVELFHPPVSITSSGAATVDATPTISWTAATGASSYEVLVTKPGSSLPIYTRTGITGTSHRIDVPLAAGISQIQVRAIFPDGSRSSLSTVQSLTIGIGTPVTFSGGALSWNSVNGATNYELWINYLGTPNRRQIVYDPMYLKTSYKLPSTLPKGRYQTWLRPVRAESGQLYYGAWTSVLFDIV